MQMRWLAVLPPLRELDQVAYLRFASVYRAFDTLDDFDQAISELRHEAAQHPQQVDSDTVGESKKA